MKSGALVAYSMPPITSTHFIFRTATTLASISSWVADRPSWRCTYMISAETSVPCEVTRAAELLIVFSDTTVRLLVAFDLAGILDIFVFVILSPRSAVTTRRDSVGSFTGLAARAAVSRILARTSFVHLDRLTIDVLAVESGDRGTSFLIAC